MTHADLRELLACYFKCKHAYHRENDTEESRIETIPTLQLIEHVKCLVAQVLYM